jgi:hypothetical protein
MDSPTRPTTELNAPAEIASDVLVAVPGCVPFVIKADHGDPPAQVLAMVAGAGHIHEGLSADGREVSFARSADGSLSIELQDAVAARARRLCLREAFALADGQAGIR